MAINTLYITRPESRAYEDVQVELPLEIWSDVSRFAQPPPGPVELDDLLCDASSCDEDAST
ncbi:hypothetical protein GBA52_003443 [Prunus armeniaca]|nr:hypothetical protein GBA52_003443 [Prunus armeniaca]